MSGLVNDGMDKGSMMESEDRIDKTVDIYISAEAVRDMKHKKDTEDFNTQTPKTQTQQHTGSDSVRIRISRAAAVCLVLLCVLLLTAVIVLCVHIYTKSTNYTEEKDQLLTNITNLTEERDQLLTNITNITEERDQLLTRNMQLTKEKDGLSSHNSDLLKQRDQLKQEKNELLKMDGWVYYQSSFYFISSEKKSWTESRRDCTERGADLIIINNRKEQEIVNMISGGTSVWIGLTDSDVENTWKWVDGSTLTSGFWGILVPNPKEPNGGRSENCAVTANRDQRWPTLSGWLDIACNSVFQWICEKSISQLTL